MAESGGTEIPDLKKLDLQLLVQDFAQARRDIFEERRNSEKRISEERERSKFELDRTMAYYESKLKDVESANKALIGLVAKMQHDIDQTREGELKKAIRAKDHNEYFHSEKPDLEQEHQGIPLKAAPSQINNSLFGMQKLPTKKDLE